MACGKGCVLESADGFEELLSGIDVGWDGIFGDFPRESRGPSEEGLGVEGVPLPFVGEGGVGDGGDEWEVVRLVGEVFGDLEVGDEGEEFLGRPAQVQGRGVGFNWLVADSAGGKEGFFALMVKDAVSVVGKDFDQLVGLVRVLVEVVVSRPDGMVEIEVSGEEGMWKEAGEGLHEVDGGVVYVVVDVEDEE